MAVVDKNRTDVPLSQAKIPISLRVKAWWDGNELQVRPKGRGGDGSDGGDSDLDIPTRTLDRPTLLQALWGNGLCDPGPEEYLLQLVKPLGLDPSMTVLHLGAGLGGAARAMVEHFGPWVLGLESDKELAAAGMALSEGAGMAKKAEILYFNPVEHTYRPNTADAVLSKEFFWRVNDKDRMIMAAHTLLKERGQLLFTDYVLAEGTNESDLTAWADRESESFSLWTQAQYEEILEARKLDVRISEDITKDYVRLVTDGWGSFLKNSRIDDLCPETGGALIREAEIWTERVKAMDEGQVNVQRFYAIKKTSSGLTMSDW